MGDISVIARRLSDKYVQHGWSGNGGCFVPLGAVLLKYYDDPQMVEYLFGLGQCSEVRAPHSEGTGARIRTCPTGEPHWVSDSEQKVFTKLCFIDYVYFYDRDNEWYYIDPGPMSIKMPLVLVAYNLDKSYEEFKFTQSVRRKVAEKIMETCDEDPAYREHLEKGKYDAEETKRIIQEILDDEETGMHPIHALNRYHRHILSYFDDWAVVRATEDSRSVANIILKPKTETHIETCFW